MLDERVDVILIQEDINLLMVHHQDTLNMTSTHKLLNHRLVAPDGYLIRATQHCIGDYTNSDNNPKPHEVKAWLGCWSIIYISHFSFKSFLSLYRTTPDFTHQTRSASWEHLPTTPPNGSSRATQSGRYER